MIIGEQSAPRYEYRTFGQCFCNAARLMARMSIPVPEKVWDRRSNETYIISRNNNVCNTKIRDGKMDVKRLVRRVDNLEQWEPLMKSDFPVNADLLAKEFFPALMVKMPEMKNKTYSFEEFLALVRKCPELQAVDVMKRRFGYMVNDTICETAMVLINGARVMSISSESTDAEAVTKTVSSLGLADVENINYLEAIKRVVGFSNAPLANFCLCNNTVSCGCHECDCNMHETKC